MKKKYLILSSNKSKQFSEYFKKLKITSGINLDYENYSNFVIEIDPTNSNKFHIVNTIDNKTIETLYSVIYFKSWIADQEIAIAMANIFDFRNIAFVDQEIKNSASTSKLTEYIRLTKNNILIPDTRAGYSSALLAYLEHNEHKISFPCILKKADAARGENNYFIENTNILKKLLSADQNNKSIWILQNFVPNNGFYRVMVYGDKSPIVIFRELKQREDGNKLKAHMYKPRGGKNATLITNLSDKFITAIREVAVNSAQIMNRQIAGVDLVVDKNTNVIYAIEVNNNPELVKLNTFQKERELGLINFLESF
jgi:glutathione synthase/RimK-type ligase-like ATP-grasp enzyme